MTDLRNSNCDKCTLSNGCDFVCDIPQWVRPQDRSFMVIGDYPSLEGETLMTTELMEAKFSLFWKVATSVCNVEPDKVYGTYVAKCNPGDKKPTSEQNMTCASTYLKKEIMLVRPKAILLLGGAAASVFGFGDNISKMAGQSKEVTFGKGDNQFTTTIIATFSPNYIQYNEHLLKKFAIDIDKAWKIATGLSAGTPLPTKVTMCTTMDQVHQVIEYIKESGYCVPDFESTKLTDMNVFDPNFKVTLLAVSFQHGSAYTIPLFHFDSPFTKEEVMYILNLFAEEVWGNPAIHKINQNIKFDMRVQQRYTPDIVFRGRHDCTMVMHSLYDDLSKHGIKEWLPGFFPRFMGWELQVKGQGWDKIPLNTLSDYAGIDADGAFRGYTVLLQKLLEDQRVYDLYRNLYMFALPTLLGMEMRGMPIDRALILKFEARALELIGEQTKKMNAYPQVRAYCAIEKDRVIMERLNELRSKRAASIESNRLKQAEKYLVQIKEVKAGKSDLYDGINFGSPDQLCGLLYSKEGFKFKVPYDRKTRGPKEQTGEDEVKALGDKSGFINDLLVLRSIKSTYSKYLKGIRLQLDDNDCVHTTYNQARTKTGRLSSGGENAGPNLQNIVTHVKIKHPFVEEVTMMAKKAFMVPDGYTLLNWDQSQAELRAIAELANEENMIAAYNRGEDVHINTARAILGLTYEQFMQLPEKDREDHRQGGKAANFGLIYGQGIPGFMEYAKNTYGVVFTLAEATRVFNAFFTLYPRIAEYHQIYIGKGKKYGYVRSLFGRRAHYPDINALDKFKRGNAERELVNMPVQSTNGEITVFALALLERRLPASVLLSNSVHDSVMALIPNQFVPYVAKVGIDTCQNTPMLKYFGKEMVKLKMKTDCQFSLTNWKELKKYTEESWQEAIDNKIK